MPLRPTVSILEASIMPQIKNYLKSRMNEDSKKKELSPEDGINVITEAIAIGINEAFKGGVMSAALAAIIDTNVGAPAPPILIGTVAYSTVITPATAPGTQPNPLV